MSRPFKLLRLQQIDTQLDWANNRLAEIETALHADEAVRSAEAGVEAAQGRLKLARQALQHTENDVRQQRIKIEQNEASLYGGKIHNPKELKDLENEVASLKRYLAVLEDRQLDSMMVEEEAAELEQSAAAELEKTRANFSTRSQDLVREQEKILKDRARLENERSAAAGAVTPEDLAVYMQLRKTRRGVAVAKIVDRSCSACGSQLNAALLNAAHSPNILSMCDTCGRVLYTG